MKLVIESNKVDSGRRAAEAGAAGLRQAIAARGVANIIVATGASQFQMLEALTEQPDVQWDKVNVFHLDEYVGLPIAHPASFRAYLWHRFHAKLSLPVRAFHYLDAEHDPQAEAARIGAILRQHPIDVCFAGIGENGHLAFNDPPADFDTDEPYLVVDLDEACRKQQLGEGWFPTLADVPAQAVSMSVKQIMKSRQIICTVPDARKAEAVRAAVEGPVTNQLPASILQQHDHCTLYLDAPAASRLEGQPESSQA
ncbi:MAG: glucosamine-6-phosphate deaminase [Phycisphaeraceae bacterium]